MMVTKLVKKPKTMQRKPIKKSSRVGLLPEKITIYNDPDWAKPEVITHEGHQYVLKFVSCSKKLCNDKAWRMNRGLGPWPEMKGRNTIIHELSNWKENYGVYVYVERLGEIK